MTDNDTKERRSRVINLPGYTKHFTRADADRKWLLVDASGRSVGRLATEIASLLRGKHKPTYTRHDDVGDFVVVINAEKAELRGNEKLKKKKYYKHTGWFGHLRSSTAAEMQAKKPEFLIEKAVYGMLSHGSLGDRMMKKLKIYAGPNHPHKAQNPEPYQVKER